MEDMQQQLHPITARTRSALLRRVSIHRPREYADVEATVDQLIEWSIQSPVTLVPLEAGEQNTVGFSLSSQVVLWRAYPQKTVPAKVTILPGFARQLIPSERDRLVQLISEAIPGTTIAREAYLEVRLRDIADSKRFARFSEVLRAAAELGETLA
jgi:hypothetical protein